MTNETEETLRVLKRLFSIRLEMLHFSKEQIISHPLFRRFDGF